MKEPKTIKETVSLYKTDLFPVSDLTLLCNMHQVNIRSECAALYGNIRSANQVENDEWKLC